MARQRAIELAMIAGRGPADVTQFDYERAKREIIGQAAANPRAARSKTPPETTRWNPLPVMAAFAGAPDNEDGRSETGPLIVGIVE